MNAVLIRRLSEPPMVVQACGTVIVEDVFGFPLVVVQEVAGDPRAVSITTFKDARFRDVLASLGLDKIVVDRPFQPQGPGTGQNIEYGRQLPLLDGRRTRTQP